MIGPGRTFQTKWSWMPKRGLCNLWKRFTKISHNQVICLWEQSNRFQVDIPKPNTKHFIMLDICSEITLLFGGVAWCCLSNLKIRPYTNVEALGKRGLREGLLCMMHIACTAYIYKNIITSILYVNINVYVHMIILNISTKICLPEWTSLTKIECIDVLNCFSLPHFGSIHRTPWETIAAELPGCLWLLRVLLPRQEPGFKTPWLQQKKLTTFAKVLYACKNIYSICNMYINYVCMFFLSDCQTRVNYHFCWKKICCWVPSS